MTSQTDMSANQLSLLLDSPAHGGSEQGLVRQWSADCAPEVLAMEMVADICKKFRQLDAMPPEKFETIAQGLVDGIKATTFPHPMGSSIPHYRRSMDPNYCAGFEVGSTWRKISQEWPESQNL